MTKIDVKEMLKNKPKKLEDRIDWLMKLMVFVLEEQDILNFKINDKSKK